MIYKINVDQRRKLLPMFQSMKDTMILSCLQGHMGTVWVDDLANPTVVQVLVGMLEIQMKRLLKSYYIILLKKL